MLFALKVLALSIFSKFIHFMANLLLVYSTNCDDTFTKEYNFQRFLFDFGALLHTNYPIAYTVTTLQSN